MKKIGMTGGLLAPDLNRDIFIKKQLCYTEQDFANYWASFGVMPVLIPNLSPQYLDAFLGQLDGLALLGGTDINPNRYQEKPIGAWTGDPLRDAYEWNILDWFVQKEKPIFGVCRGFQLLNVYYGGSLYQDLPTQLPSATIHADKGLYDKNYHKIRLAKGELLEQLNIAKNSPLINSLHHQGIKKLAQPLKALAWSEEGLIEAFYHTEHPKGKVMAVQWHPEFFVNARPKLVDSRSIIQYFLKFL